MGGQSDAAALRRVRRDPDAIVALYDRYVLRLVAALVHEGAGRELAFDLAQETFARTLERGHRVRIPEDGSAWPWLWTVARNLYRDWRRREVVDRSARDRLRISSVEYEESAFDDLAARLEAESLHAALAEALGELPIDQREAVVGRVVLGRDYRRLAGSSTNVSAVRARVSRGLRALRLRLSGGRP
jgi:RNA polymerase sigma factor (sigma-70 family)